MTPITQDNSQTSVTEKMRKEIFDDRELFIFYTNLLKGLNRQFVAAAANNGDLALNEGKAAGGIKLAGDLAEAAPGGGIINAILSLFSAIFGGVKKRKTAKKHEAIERLSGDFDPTTWAAFSKELAIGLTLNNKDLIKSTNQDIQPYPNEQSFQSVSKKGRKEISELSKDQLEAIMDQIKKIEEGGINIAFDRKEAVSTLTRSSSLTKSFTAQSNSTSPQNNRSHEDYGRFTHEIIDREARHHNSNSQITTAAHNPNHEHLGRFTDKIIEDEEHADTFSDPVEHARMHPLGHQDIGNFTHNVVEHESHPGRNKHDHT